MSERRAGIIRWAGWCLAVSYGVGAPVTAILELGSHLLSRKFDYPPALILLVCGIQLACAAVILVPSLAPWAAAALTVTTLGAVASHIRIGSPATAVPAALFTALQLWYGLKMRRPAGA
jgi:DoxX-like family